MFPISLRMSVYPTTYPTSSICSHAQISGALAADAKPEGTINQLTDQPTQASTLGFYGGALQCARRAAPE